MSSTQSASAARAAARALLAAGALPPHVDQAARLHLLDSLGVGVGAAIRGPVRALASSAGRLGGPGRGTVIGQPERVHPATAALVNGTLIHSLEFDDTHAASIVHGSSVLTGAAVAAGESDDREWPHVVRAYALGWELFIRLGLAGSVAIQRRGFQVTSVLGPFAAAAVGSLLSGADEDGIVRALGIASSQSAGNFSFLESAAFTKALQPGWAAHSGLLAVELARAGITTAEGSLDGACGVYALYGDGAPASLAGQLESLGQEWHLPEAAYKLLPCCHFIHSYVDAVAELRSRAVDAEDVVKVIADVPEEACAIIADPWAQRQRPATAHAGRWSLPYVLGIALAHGSVSLADFDGAVDPEAIQFAQRCELSRWPGSGFPQRFPARLTVQTAGGRAHRIEIDDVRGGGSRPVGESEILAKFRANAALGLPDADAARLEELVLGTASTVGEITALLRTVRSRS
jgi:2-methylcitrate dehydratase PrpD